MAVRPGVDQPPGTVSYSAGRRASDRAANPAARTQHARASGRQRMRTRADARGFAMLAEYPPASSAIVSQRCCTPARVACRCSSGCGAEVEPTIGALINGLTRVQELRELASGLGAWMHYRSRLRALMMDAERCRAADIAKITDVRPTVTLMAFAITASERGQDEVLELFARLHGALCCASGTERARAPRRR